MQEIAWQCECDEAISKTSQGPWIITTNWLYMFLLVNLFISPSQGVGTHKKRRQERIWKKREGGRSKNSAEQQSERRGIQEVKASFGESALSKRFHEVYMFDAFLKAARQMTRCNVMVVWICGGLLEICDVYYALIIGTRDWHQQWVTAAN